MELLVVIAVIAILRSAVRAIFADVLAKSGDIILIPRTLYSQDRLHDAVVIRFDRAIFCRTDAAIAFSVSIDTMRADLFFDCFKIFIHEIHLFE